MPEIADYMSRWHLISDGPDFETSTSDLKPVLTKDGAKAMLKVAKAHGKDELTALMLAHFDSHGAVRLLAEEGPASLMERATGPRSLKEMALSGDDQQATQIICATVRQLHSAIGLPTGALRLADIFAPLLNAASGQTYGASAASARHLLLDTTNVALHGDIHHENIMDSSRGWLAIDPKGRIGPPQYDYANLFLNPFFEHALVLDHIRMQNLARWISDASGIDRSKILHAAHAHAGLSACWSGSDTKGRKYALKAAGLLHQIMQS